MKIARGNDCLWCVLGIMLKQSSVQKLPYFIFKNCGFYIALQLMFYFQCIDDNIIFFYSYIWMFGHVICIYVYRIDASFYILVVVLSGCVICFSKWFFCLHELLFFCICNYEIFIEISGKQKNQTTWEGKNMTIKDNDMFLFTLWLLSMWYLVHPVY